MKKIEKLTRIYEIASKKLEAVSVVLRDTSYRRAGGYFGTIPADTEGLTVWRTFNRDAGMSFPQDFKF